MNNFDRSEGERKRNSESGGTAEDERIMKDLCNDAMFRMNACYQQERIRERINEKKIKKRTEIRMRVWKGNEGEISEGRKEGNDGRKDG